MAPGRPRHVGVRVGGMGAGGLRRFDLRARILVGDDLLMIWFVELERQSNGKLFTRIHRWRCSSDSACRQEHDDEAHLWQEPHHARIVSSLL